MAKSPAAKKTIAKDKGPKRALSSYMFFSTENRDRIMKANGFEPKQIGEIAKKIGEQWKSLSAKDKAPYEAKAKKDKERYENEKAKSK